jgi:hypothetical protein
VMEEQSPAGRVGRGCERSRRASDEQSSNHRRGTRCCSTLMNCRRRGATRIRSGSLAIPDIKDHLKWKQSRIRRPLRSSMS